MESSMLLEDNYIKLSEAVFLLLAYYGHHDLKTTHIYFSHTKLRVFCAIVSKDVLEKTPVIVRQAIEYVKCLQSYELRELRFL